MLSKKESNKILGWLLVVSLIFLFASMLVDDIFSQRWLSKTVLILGMLAIIAIPIFMLVQIFQMRTLSVKEILIKLVRNFLIVLFISLGFYAFLYLIRAEITFRDYLNDIFFFFIWMPFYWLWNGLWDEKKKEKV